MTDPVLSIIIPVYNLEEYLDGCIESILSQEYKDYELLLINDGSTDVSGTICEDYARKDKRVKVHHQENSGVSVARNVGLQKSRGDWICFIDADDKIEQNSLLAIMEEVIKKDPELLIAKSYKSEKGKKTEENYPFDQRFLKEEYSGYRLFVEKSYKRGSVCGCILKKDFLKRNVIRFPVGLQNAEDSIFMTLCYLYAGRIVFTPIDFYLVTERAGSASRDWTSERIFKMVDNLKYLNRYKNNGTGFSNEQRAMLDYNRYAVVSAIFNNFYYCFTWKDFRNLKSEVRKHLKGKIQTEEITLSRSKIKILNFSLNLFAHLVLVNQWGRR